MSDAAERSEQPTARKLKEAKRKGSVAISRDMNVFVVLLTAMTGIYLMLGTARDKLCLLIRNTFDEAVTREFDFHLVIRMMQEAFIVMMSIVIPIWIIILLSSLLIHAVQAGFFFSWEAVRIKGERLSISNGFKRIYSMRSLVEMIKSSWKILLCFVVCGFIIKGNVRSILLLVNAKIDQLSAVMGSISWKAGRQVVVLLGILAAGDYWYQRWSFMKQMKMTRQEVRQDFKEEEGDPHLKMRRRQLFEEYVLNMMIQGTEKADVVIVNPSRIAVALRYEPKLMNAPRVIAKGEGKFARIIRDVAEKYNIPVFEHVSLARALNVIRVGNEIPTALYETVAEILNLAYRKLGTVTY
jgi:flagellar biosynthesis protein FlhB